MSEPDCARIAAELLYHVDRPRSSWEETRKAIEEALRQVYGKGRRDERVEWVEEFKDDSGVAWDRGKL